MARFRSARGHRNGNVLVVVWHDGVSSSTWEAVNVAVEQRLMGRVRAS